jgi:replicative DNA helicase
MKTKDAISEVVQYGKVPPQAVDIEVGLLGSLILESDSLGLIHGILSENSFYKQENRTIYKTILDLYRDGKTIDLVIITRKLNDLEELENIGGPMYLTKLTSEGSFGINPEQYAKIIQQKFVKRESIRICSEIINQSYDGELDVEDIITNIQKAGNELENYFDAVDNGSTTRIVAKETLEEIYADVDRNRKGIPAGIDTGFIELNKMIGGFKPASLIIMASRPGIGKTSLALHFAVTAALKNNYVNFFSFEMTKTQLFKILIAGGISVNRTDIRDGNLTDNDLDLINISVGEIEDLPILWNTRRMTVHQIKSVVRKNKRQNKCDIVVIDYLQLINPTDSKNIREQQISEISRELKSMTVEFGIPIIALSQLNRLAETEVPQLRHLRESGALEQDADNVLFPYKEVDAELQETSYSIINAKARNGYTGRFDIWHNSQMTKFGNKGDQRAEQQFEYNVNQQFEPSREFDNDDNPF